MNQYTFRNFFASDHEVSWGILTLTPLPLLSLIITPVLPFSYQIRCGISVLSVILNLIFAFYNGTKTGKFSGLLSMVLIYFSFLPMLLENPVYMLAGNVLFIILFFFAVYLSSSMQYFEGYLVKKYFRNVSVALHVFTVIILIVVFTEKDVTSLLLAIPLTSFVFSQFAFVRWSVSSENWFNVFTSIMYITIGVAVTVLGVEFWDFVLLFFSVAATAQLYICRKQHGSAENWWDVFMSHPGRVLFSSFFILCLVGTVLLLIPAATSKGDISFIDAVFTSVSAVCVTGLIVLDTPKDFSMFGQIIILILIQLGGLGIMSLTTVAIQTFGKRLSLKHETVLTSMTETDHKTLLSSLAMILKYTFTLEFIGGAVLIVLFYRTGDSIDEAVWRGVFTSVSAFCNAGFALQSDSLISYNNNSYILNTVALLIFFGGIAPVIALSIPALVMGKKIPLGATLALWTSIILIFAGALLLLIFEWNGIFKGMNLVNKLFNSLFQSVTLRTAGFNSVELGHITNPSLIIMLIFMFIGGSPGGTAGGIKTTAVSILALTFWANITNRKSIVLQNKKIAQSTVNKAVTIVISGFIFWFLSVIMIEVTQQIPTRELIFEVTSAIGTVGLSTGATGMLDGVGKIIIIVTMFAGRLGPMTLFTIMSGTGNTSGTEYIEENITIT
ncbi:H(+)-transporting two-sector ATPase [Denitrovibrio acetiphilus DSM 12809]|uniref:H(+)-transporting two-sector ATPase n=1 Tax=Denitrovibrio acetiphilus (strain DSM 12809 / NBRC 114555 / N2460) TaxID=522772 RepID=D4H7Q6_DENA2|nr:potassium transporter TrkG [Denitrovibrio acetiphilus]ADD68055.1 H(+)-transporting two-sector ATPase [Denitrovibrio acetiphilus DSM 12809]